MAPSSLFHPCRIRKHDPTDKDSLGVTSDELFWNFLFGNAFGYVASYFVADQYFAGFFYCLAFFTTYVNQAAYSTRFNDNDLIHRAFWVMFGVGIAGMVVNIGVPGLNGHFASSAFVYFAGFFAWPKLCICLMYARVAWCLPEARGLAVAKVIELGTQAGVWVTVAIVVRCTGSNGCVWLLVLLMLCDLLAVVPYSLSIFKVHTRVTISIECTAAKYNGLNGMMVVPIAAKVISDMHDWPEIGVSCYVTGFAAVMFTVLLNGILAQVNIMVPFEVHALRLSVLTSWLWFLLQFCWVASALMTSVGFTRIFKSCPELATAGAGGEEQACLGAACLFAVLTALDLIHDAPWVATPKRGWGGLGPLRGVRIATHAVSSMVSSLALLAPTFFVAPILLLAAAVSVVLSSYAALSSASGATQEQSLQPLSHCEAGGVG